MNAGAATEPDDTTSILLVHGIWNAKSWLVPMARLLRGHGFQVRTFGYPSVFGGPEPAVEALVACLRDGAPTHVVGHSLGGMIGVEALRRAPALPVRRMVCLGSPLCGSATARSLVARAWSSWVLGRSGTLLRDGCTPWRGAVPIGMVAGNVPRGVGRLLTRFEGGSDGTVGLAETRLPGLADHCEVAASHTGLVFSRAAAAQTARFLRTGRFLRDGTGTGAV